MSAVKEKQMLLSPRESGMLRLGGIVAGVIGWVAEIAALAIAGFGVAGATVVYDLNRIRKERKKVRAGAAHH